MKKGKKTALVSGASVTAVSSAVAEDPTVTSITTELTGAVTSGGTVAYALVAIMITLTGIGILVKVIRRARG
ncbi:MAG: hypothetical protein AAGH40_14035 [Verrucomicrobiota bacterium]